MSWLGALASRSDQLTGIFSGAEVFIVAAPYVAKDGGRIPSMTLGVVLADLRVPHAIWTVIGSSIRSGTIRLRIARWGPWCRSTGELFIVEIVG